MELIPLKDNTSEELRHRRLLDHRFGSSSYSYSSDSSFSAECRLTLNIILVRRYIVG
ncbi:MAG: hypothetical protein H7644_00120 [Candidatus Heimdallarchaeota archaeon]|nr:hypothetical protein [Candidatus Heimdallarchaeota archaeon]MCK5142156.1 hypothetical protein [Candidatus Heimdallarchaeota archaeon]